jgi:hypothetical protein
MMRLAWIIIGLTAISATVVHLRCRQSQTRTEMYALESQRVQVRRTLWEQQVRLGDLTSPQNIRRLTFDWPLEIVSPGEVEPVPPTAKDKDKSAPPAMARATRR